MGFYNETDDGQANNALLLKLHKMNTFQAF